MSSDQGLLTLLNNRISKTTKLIKEKQADALVILIKLIIAFNQFFW